MSLLSLSKKILSRTSDQVDQKKQVAAPAVAKEQEGTEVPVSVLAGDIGLLPVLSEKSMVKQGENTVVFRVLPTARKKEIAAAVKERYGVKVLRVRTAQMMPKTRRRGSSIGLTNRWKKAYVTVDDVQKLNATP